VPYVTDKAAWPAGGII